MKIKRSRLKLLFLNNTNRTRLDNYNFCIKEKQVRKIKRNPRNLPK